MPLVGGTLAVACAGAVGYTERLLTVERDRAQIRSTFGHMVSPQVMEHVLRSLLGVQSFKGKAERLEIYEVKREG